jgi:hypothetical protein
MVVGGSTEAAVPGSFSDGSEHHPKPVPQGAGKPGAEVSPN